MIQPIYDTQFTVRALLAKIEKIVAQQEVDIVVFPESFYQAATYDAAMKIMYKMADKLRVALLSGVSLADGSEWALYYNPNPKDWETRETAFVKHSTATKLAFDYDPQVLTDKDVYRPIYLKDYALQAIISHDLFFPLITERLEREGMDMLIHLTEGNVKMSKWHNVLRGRSFETSALILCTMGHDPEQKQASDIIAYRKGVRIVPEFMVGDSFDHEDACHLFDLACLEYVPEKNKNYYSDKKYEAFTIGNDVEADVYFDSRRKRVKTKLDKVEQHENSFVVEKNGERVHIHSGTFKDLKNRLYVHNQPSTPGEHHIIVYHVNKYITNKQKAIALLKLRAIENRIAVVLITKNMFIGAKTTRYKDIQLFNPIDEKIGFDLTFMKGIDSVFQRSNRKLGIPKKYEQAYLSLKHEQRT